jgi:hypothetical protein
LFGRQEVIVLFLNTYKCLWKLSIGLVYSYQIDC